MTSLEQGREIIPLLCIPFILIFRQRGFFVGGETLRLFVRWSWGRAGICSWRRGRASLIDISIQCTQQLLGEALDSNLPPWRGRRFGADPDNATNRAPFLLVALRGFIVRPSDAPCVFGSDQPSLSIYDHIIIVIAR